MAPELITDITYCGLSICSNDADWFEFDLVDGFFVDVLFDAAFGDLDVEVYSAKTLAFVDGAYTTGDDEFLSAFSLASGTYWARVIGKNGDENSDYCISISTF
jgi:hypothetical protein